MASSDSVCVSVAISPSSMSFLMISGTGDAEVLGDVLDGRAGVDLDDVGAAGRWRPAATVSVVGAAPAPAAAPRRAPLRAAAGPPPGRRRAAGAAGGGRPAESMTTRRPPPGRRRARARPGARSASGRRGPSLRAAAAAAVAAAARAACAPSPGLRLGLRALRLRASCPAGGRRAEVAGCRDRRAARSCGCAAALLRLGAVGSGTFLPVSAASARVSSTAEAAAFTSMPAAFSRFEDLRGGHVVLAWPARGRASWPCVDEVYGLLRDGHRRPEAG